MTRQEQNQRVLHRLWIYGLLRLMGAPVRDVPRITAQSLGSSDILDTYISGLVAAGASRATHQDLLSAPHAASAIGIAATQRVLEEVISSVASSVPVASIVFAAAEWLAKLFAYASDRRQPSGCDTVCKGNKEYDRRALIGMHPPPGRRDVRGAITKRMGDGAIWEGLFASRPAYIKGTSPDDPDTEPQIFIGAKGGVVAPFYEHRNVGKEWRRIQSHAKARQDLINWKRLSQNVPLGLVGQGWKRPSNNYCYREWVAGRLMKWFENATSCSALICANTSLTTIGNAYYDPECRTTGTRRQGKINVPIRTAACTDGKSNDVWMRQVGSVWYATLWFMHADFSGIVHYLGKSKSAGILARKGYDSAAAVVRTNTWDKSKSPFEYYSASSKLNLEQLQGALQSLAIYLPAAFSIKPPSAGGGARATAVYQAKTPNPFAMARVQIAQRVSAFQWTRAHTVGTVGLGGLSAAFLYLYFKKR